MDLMSNKIRMDELRPGDHIYTWRHGYFYSHHGIYMGDGNVIHLTRGPGLIISSSSDSQASSDRVECCNIQNFLRDGQLYRFEYGVSKSLLLINRAGTCCLASSNPPQQVLHNASYLLEHGFGNYDLLSKNCEDFALYCKTSIVKVNITGSRIKFSGQINSLLAAFLAITTIPYKFLNATLFGVVVCGLYCSFTLSGDRSKLVANARNASSILKLWYRTPDSKILRRYRTWFLYSMFSVIVSDHLRLHGFNLEEYSAYTIWLLGHLYRGWTSVSTFLPWPRSLYLSDFVRRFVSDAPRQLKLRNYVAHTMQLFLVWYWTPRIIILQWIKLALVYKFLFHFISNHLRNHRLVRWEAFFVCFVIQSLALFLGPDYCDYVFRITKITFV